MAKIRILQGMFLITSLFMAFLYINNPFQEIQSLAVIVDFFGLSAAFLFIIFLSTPSLQDIQLKSGKEFFEEYSIGAVLGLVAHINVLQLALSH